jgi:hypothetical protein
MKASRETQYTTVFNVPVLYGSVMDCEEKKKKMKVNYINRILSCCEGMYKRGYYTKSRNKTRTTNI